MFSFLFLYDINFFLIFFYLIFIVVLSLILIFLSLMLRYVSITKPNLELSSAYECGFLPFDKSRAKFEIKFFMISLLFVIFDLEIIFVFPWSICIFFFDLKHFFLMVFFLSLLGLSFLFELSENALYI